MWPFRRRETRDASMTLDQLLAERSMPTWAGVPVDADQALRLGAVWSCTRLLADTVSTLPVAVYRQGQRQPLDMPAVLARPAAGMSTHEWLYSVMTSLLLRGNAYGLITARSGATLLPTQIELINPDFMLVTLTSEGMVEYRLNGEKIDRADLWHVKAYTVPGLPFPGLPVGLSPVEYARQTIGLGLAAEKFGAQFFSEGGVPAGVLSTDSNLTADLLQRMKETWKIARQGTRDTAILTGGLKYQPISVQPDESQFLESMQFNVSQIARIFGVPPEMIGGKSTDSMTYANVVERDLQFLKYSVAPWLVRLETAMGALLPRSWRVKFNADALLRTDTKTRYEAHEIGIRSGFLRVNEVRDIEDLEPLAEDAPEPGAVA